MDMEVFDMFNLIHATIFSAFDAPFELGADSETAVANSPLGIAELYTIATKEGTFAVKIVFDSGASEADSVLFFHVLATFSSRADAKAFMLDFIANHNARTGHDAGFRYGKD